eukprot:CAMPEP_0172620412 /NCGR_PEP_ID=MMETSP1068-20121228/103432_1 /TAXON_ID=35684 /ORGANISM="Pseudopedinella elastica, Strain CCMP716" /LENGTH=230 /DNA_ID=CAMNT_0013427663 /DNA_START=79 /DNA_END=772 /DNA_ORIENTATION=+
MPHKKINNNKGHVWLEGLPLLGPFEQASHPVKIPKLEILDFAVCGRRFEIGRQFKVKHEEYVSLQAPPFVNSAVAHCATRPRTGGDGHGNARLLLALQNHRPGGGKAIADLARHYAVPKQRPGLLGLSTGSNPQLESARRARVPHEAVDVDPVAGHAHERVGRPLDRQDGLVALVGATEINSSLQPVTTPFLRSEAVTFEIASVRSAGVAASRSGTNPRVRVDGLKTNTS